MKTNNKFKKILIWFGGLACGLFITAALAGSTSKNTQIPAAEIGSLTKVKTQAAIPQSTPLVEIKTENNQEIIPFRFEERNNNSLDRGESSISQAGVNGVITQFIEVTYKDGVESSRKVIREERKEPISQIIQIGTRIIPPPTSAPLIQNNLETVVDSYTNVDGNQVQVPTYYDSAPAGASAECRDGTYSFSKNRRGTCSGHGGVARWL